MKIKRCIIRMALAAALVIVTASGTMARDLEATGIPQPADTASQRAGHLPFLMSIKTNLLYDAAALPNLGFEFAIGRNWSAGVNWTYAWWSRRSHNRFYRCYSREVNFRRWFCSREDGKRLTGHHAGLFGGVLTYDFEFGGTGIMGGLPGKSLWQRCNWMAGVEYGYSFSLKRKFNLDLTLGLGYVGGKQVRYEPENGCYVWKDIRNTRWIGPVKGEVTFVFFISEGI